MKDLEFGLIMTIAGMGVTFLTLLLLGIIISLLSRVFPFIKEESDKS